MPKYVKAEPGPGASVIYTDVNGRQWKFSGGTRPWRNQNPGNLVVGNVSKRNGAIGKAGGFAVFPDYETGHAALVDSLKNMHGTKNIRQLMRVYAPSKENKTSSYIKFIHKKTGVQGDKKVQAFTEEEFIKLWRAIEQMEGWGPQHEGTIEQITSKKQVTGVRKNRRGTIEAYEIEGYGWVSKSTGIELARQGKLDAVVARSPRGNLFLRARPNHDQTDNLETKG